MIVSAVKYHHLCNIHSIFLIYISRYQLLSKFEWKNVRSLKYFVQRTPSTHSIVWTCKSRFWGFQKVCDALKTCFLTNLDHLYAITVILELSNWKNHDFLLYFKAIATKFGYFVAFCELLCAHIRCQRFSDVKTRYWNIFKASRMFIPFQRR